MRKLTYYVATSLDGFIADPTGADPSAPGGLFTLTPDYVEQMITHYPETLPVMAREAMGITASGTSFDTVVEGRRSYQLGLDMGVTNAYPHLRHYVFSRTLGPSQDPSVDIVATDPVEKIRELKAQDGLGIWLVGGGELAGALHAEIDELILKVNPVTACTGIPLFGDKTPFSPHRYTLTDNTALPSGALFLTYTRTP
ncbi:dihydrofolate reductase family protein (plasmid) [Streptosporangium sp. CA-135522]|uniref:dihydrofolate reductase family protein n=1 Tax=Streptosporangium sp. CA-135522 TaxID=3240072 RepID=UPI003D8DDDCC